MSIVKMLIFQISRPEPSKPVKSNIPAKDPELNKVTPKSSSSATADLLSLSEPPAPQNGSLLSMASTRQDTTADVSTRKLMFIYVG